MTIPKFHDERLGMLPDKFFTALGHLQYAYTSLEVQLACTISQFVTLGYDPGTHFPMMDRVNAVLGGMRMDVATATLKRLLRVSNAPKEVNDYLAELTKHLGDIQHFRNRLTHHTTARRLKKAARFVNTDLEVAKEQSKALTFEFGYEALNAARHDLHMMADILDRMFDWNTTTFVLEPPAWLYKPAMLAR